MLWECSEATTPSAADNSPVHIFVPTGIGNAFLANMKQQQDEAGVLGVRDSWWTPPTRQLTLGDRTSGFGVTADSC